MTQHSSRRQFLAAATAAGVSTVWATPAFAMRELMKTVARIPSVPRDPKNRKVLHLVGYGHLDAAWLWPWRDAENLAVTTMQSAVDRMREFPEFCYSHSSAAHWRCVRRDDPRLFSEVVRRAKEGRFEAIGGWVIEPDCNIPSTESFMRQSLYGKRYFREHVGVDVLCGANPDSFGHSSWSANYPHTWRATVLRFHAP